MKVQDRQNGPSTLPEKNWLAGWLRAWQCLPARTDIEGHIIPYQEKGLYMRERTGATFQRKVSNNPDIFFVDKVFNPNY